MIAARLVAYDPGSDARKGYLPEPLSWSCSLPHNDVGVLQLRYSARSLGGDLLSQGLATGLDVALEVDAGSGWVEPPGGRFLLAARKQDYADQTAAMDLTLPSYGWLLGKMRNLALEALEPTGEFRGQRLFTNVTAGRVMRTLLDEYAARHAKPSALTWDFTTALDSALVAWPATDWAVPYAAGVDLRAVLAGLASMRLCDWRTQGRALKLWTAGSQFADRSPTVRLELVRDVVDAPSAESIEGAAGYMLVRGEGSVVSTVSDALAPSAWGDWEGYVSAGGATSVAAAESMVAQELERAGRATAEYTQTLTLDPAGVLPLRDYQPGDVVTAWTGSTRAPVRVQQLNLSMDRGAIGATVVLNDRVAPHDMRVDGRLQSLTGGSMLGGTGVQPTPAPAPPEMPIPKAPTGLALSSQAWWNAGVSRAKLGASWSAVAEDEGGATIAVTGYRLRVSPVGVETSTQSLTAVVEDLPTGITVSVQVAAVSDLGVQGQWSAVAQVSTAVPNNTLVPPTPLVLSNANGLVRVRWDGQLQAPPNDPITPAAQFASVIVQTATSEAGPWATRGSIIEPGGQWLVPIGETGTMWVRGIAVDAAGNQTGAGPASSIAVESTGVIPVEWLRAGQLEADITVAGKLVIPDASGVPRTILEPGQSRFRGDVDADSVTVRETLQLTSQANELGVGARLTLFSGVSGPATRPVLSNWWPSAVLKDAGGAEIAAADIGSVARLSGGDFVATVNSGTFYLLRQFAPDGTYRTPQPHWSWASGLEDEATNIVVIDDIVMVMEANGSSTCMLWWNAVGGLAGGTEVPWKLPKRIVSHGNTILSHFGTTSGKLTTTTRPVGPGPIAVSHASKTLSKSWVPVARGQFDFGAGADIMFAVGAGGAMDAYAFSNLAADATKGFLAPSASGFKGMGWHGSAIWLADGNRIYTLDGDNWAGATTRTIHATSSFFDSVGTQHESNIGPSARFEHRKRARWQLSGPNLDTPTGVDDIDGIRVYAGTTPATLWRQGNTSGGVSDFASATVLSSGYAWPAGKAADFPSDVPAEIRSQNGNMLIAGDGTISVGDTTIKAAGDIGAPVIIADELAVAVPEHRVGTIAGTHELAGTAGGQGGWTIRNGASHRCLVSLQIKPTANTMTGVTWTFPTPFAEPPNVQVTVTNTDSDSTDRHATYSLTETSVKVFIQRSNTNTTTVHVAAEGPTPTN